MLPDTWQICHNSVLARTFAWHRSIAHTHTLCGKDFALHLTHTHHIYLMEVYVGHRGHSQAVNRWWASMQWWHKSADLCQHVYQKKKPWNMKRSTRECGGSISIFRMDKSRECFTQNLNLENVFVWGKWCRLWEQTKALHSDECNSIKAEEMHAKRLRLASIRVPIPEAPRFVRVWSWFYSKIKKRRARGKKLGEKKTEKPPSVCEACRSISFSF